MFSFRTIWRQPNFWSTMIHPHLLRTRWDLQCWGWRRQAGFPRKKIFWIYSVIDLRGKRSSWTSTTAWHCTGWYTKLPSRGLSQLQKRSVHATLLFISVHPPTPTTHTHTHFTVVGYASCPKTLKQLYFVQFDGWWLQKCYLTFVQFIMFCAVYILILPIIFIAPI